MFLVLFADVAVYLVVVVDSVLGLALEIVVVVILLVVVLSVVIVFEGFVLFSVTIKGFSRVNTCLLVACS